MLADLGCESVVAAVTVAKALAVLDAQVIDVAMLDMNLDGDNSPAVAETGTGRNVNSRFGASYAARGQPRAAFLTLARVSRLRAC